MHLLDLLIGVDLIDQIMDFPVDPIISAKAYKYKAELLFKEYLLADSYVLYTSVLVGLLMCKLVLLFTHSDFHLLNLMLNLAVHLCGTIFVSVDGNKIYA